MEALTALVAALAVLLLAVYAVRARALTPSEARVKHLGPHVGQVERGEHGEAVFRRTSSSIPALRRILDANGYAQRWGRQIERADLKLRPGEYFMVRLGLAGAAFALCALIGQNALAFFVGLLAGGIVYMLPAYWLEFMVRRRIGRINSQLVETIDLIANGVRAGFAFAQAVDVAAGRIGGPMAVELNRMLLDINLGASTEEALSAMNERIGSDDVDMVVTAILIQRNTGGNLAEVLENVTETMRDRERVQGEIRTLTAQQQLSGWVLSLWPLVLFVIFLAVNYSMVSLFWTTGPGIALLVAWFTLWVIGIFSIRRILDIDV
jgi:tight adherence protein B